VTYLCAALFVVAGVWAIVLLVRLIKGLRGMW